MYSYIRESRDLGNGRRYITRYTPGEYLFINIIKFFFFLFVVWPLEIVLIICLAILKIIWFVISLPFKLIIRLIRRE